MWASKVRVKMQNHGAESESHQRIMIETRRDICPLYNVVTFCIFEYIYIFTVYLFTVERNITRNCVIICIYSLHCKIC